MKNSPIRRRRVGKYMRVVTQGATGSP
jgi:hypothetical protein